jgi:Xaa-Pro aminopeptidase
MRAVQTIVEGLWKLKLFNEVYDSVDGKIEQIKPASVEEIIENEKKYYRLFYMHYTSHYLGLDVHDVGNYFSNGKSRKFLPGMVFTVEPGIYINNDYNYIPESFRGIGIRIEDDIRITDKGAEILSSHIPKEIPEIENPG